MKESSQRSKYPKLGNKGRPSTNNNSSSNNKQSSSKENPLNLNHLANCLVCASSSHNNSSHFLNNQFNYYCPSGTNTPTNHNFTTNNMGGAKAGSSGKGTSHQGRQAPPSSSSASNNILTPNCGKFLPLPYHPTTPSSSASGTSSSNPIPSNGFLQHPHAHPQLHPTHHSHNSKSAHHIKQEVAGEEPKPHLCPECGKAFKQLTHLNAHQSVHSGLKPFICEYDLII